MKLESRQYRITSDRSSCLFYAMTSLMARRSMARMFTVPVQGSILCFLTSVLLCPAAEETFCEYGGRKYARGELIKTEHVCYHCTCYEGWTEPGDDQCAVIDCPWDYYSRDPHCFGQEEPGQCCPRKVCGPWKPRDDRRILSGKRRKISMHGVNVSFQPGSELTLFCVGDEGISVKGNLVSATWQKQSADGRVTPVPTGGRFKEGRPDGTTWALYINPMEAEDEGLFMCTLQTPSQRLNFTSYLKMKVSLKNRFNFCFRDKNLEPRRGCVHPVRSNYFFNVSSGSCESENVMTCDPRGNHFSTRHECLALCYDDPCDQPLDPGPCVNLISRFYYDRLSDDCKSFTYGGCRGNNNNFLTRTNCQKSCVKLSFEDGEPEREEKKMEEKSVSCPWRLWSHYMSRHCRPIHERDASCPVRFDCRQTSRQQVTDKKRESNKYSCVFRDVRYGPGEAIEVTDACQVCSCHQGFKGPGSPSCKLKKCPPSSQKIFDNVTCVPIYGHEECCPRDFYCPTSSYAQSAQAELHGDPPELRCNLGPMTYPRGYRLVTGDPCLVCLCLTPPQFTCERKTSCPEKGSSRAATANMAETPEAPCQSHPCPEGFVCEVKPTLFPRGRFVPTCRRGGPRHSFHSAPLVDDQKTILVCRTSCPSPACHVIPSLDNTCPICHCEGGQKTRSFPCADVSCNASCTSTPPAPDGCSYGCVCPKNAVEACQMVKCPSGSRCAAEEFSQPGDHLPSCLVCRGNCTRPCHWNRNPLHQRLSQCPHCICPAH